MKSLGKVGHLILLGVLLLSIFPIYFSFVVASQDNSALGKVPPPVLPGANILDNIQRVFDTVPFGQALINSLLVSAAVSVSVVLFSTLAGFAFAKLRFRGRTAALVLVVATMTVPPQLGIIPLYLLMIKFEWTDSLVAVIFPALVNAFGVFFMTQFLREALPTELLEAGRVDGCGNHRLFWHVVLPAARPAAAVLGMLTFLGTWNDFIWPLLVLQSPEQQTAQVALSTLRSGYVQDYSLALTGTLLATVPLLVVFGLLGKQLIGGIMHGAVKG
ncbi:cellobiose transport system permease protein [Allocatelliglobosispora scoriae]|uniref:Cellobiose transport system permease protein n=1 Tax=Allocatelliglobosispora scoriae TaxID=643052 RepID=A0A841BVD4_9ACTN|nr:carbohydrate ABC transporter permease [Allocatelliglobosispora scoriae]MBB5871408.1 cellobiose transport system permease protein [Allocatelliglobosispora scoriae]